MLNFSSVNWTRVASANYTVPASLNGKKGVVIYSCQSGSGTNPAAMTRGTAGLTNITETTIASSNYGKIIASYGTFVGGKTLTNTNASADGRSSAGISVFLLEN